MRRGARRGRRLTWIIFALCALLVVDVLAWMTVQTLRLETREREARQQADLKELVRRVLWDMESLVIPILTTESGRPFFHYQAFYPAERAYTRMFEELNPEDVLQPSPLLSESGPFIRLHYEIEPGGAIRSPQAPTGNMQDLAEARGLRTGGQIAMSRLRLLELEDMLTGERLASGELDGEPPAEVSLGAPFQSDGEVFKQIGESLSKDDFESRRQVLEQASNLNYQITNAPALSEAPARADAQPPADELTDARLGLRSAEEIEKEARRAGEPLAGRKARELLDASEGNARARDRVVDLDALGKDAFDKNNRNKTEELGALGRESEPNEQPITLWRADHPPAFVPIWRRDPASGSPELFFERTIELAGQTRTQGFWVDWPALRAAMLNAVVRPRPDVAGAITGEFRADLVPMLTDAPSSAALRLASVPVRLVPTMLPSPAEGGLSSPIRVTLLITWLATLVAIGSIAIVLRAAMGLSERRGRFVSAVTHELRTPMTTFRMYSEMLAGGMVRDEAKRERYLATLRDEAGRLSRIVESVLAYARLDKTRAQRSTGRAPAREVLDRIVPELRRIGERAGVELVMDITDEAQAALIPDDAEAIERICCNLVDNACKYGRESEPRVELSVAASGGRLRVRVRDFGKGIAWSERARVFAEFDRATHEGDSKNPGLGLGLALSRGLARELGGDLVLVRHDGPGAMFELCLPAS